ncbi:abscisate beta-glucosyltransferase-like [Punica granatum]|uniref:Abscisate beta-glucosyltransferase-like n=2 Tax=Punica granatum TaxID=22663 RepID=A0A6P8CI08_PUNGR|nr:abscisate beta-glucosyltransferase-like [Punica granatum]PKI33538.1 hypothetical protein CRG98_046094 [Punica granatum]
MSSSTASVPLRPVEMFFFPFVGGGHQIPMVDMARVFAAHGANSIILAAPSAAPSFQKSIAGDQRSGRPIKVHTLQLPENAVSPDSDMSAAPFTDTSALQQPLRELLLERKPDCIVVDMFHRWSGEVIDATGVPRVVFNGSACFPRCAMEMMKIYNPREGLSSEFEPFLIPGLPDKIVMTESQLPHFDKGPPGGGNRPRGAKMGGPDKSQFGVVVNSFYDLEPKYVDLFRNELGTRAWVVGPVSLCNRDVKDKAVRGKESSIDEETCLNWLDSKEPNSVLYVSFGSLVRMAPIQILELAHGLEASGESFVWVVGKISSSDGNGEKSRDVDCLPDGFEERMRESKRGLIIRGWAPQLLILEHPSVGGFMTHCGWNSTLEGVSSGVPMITYPVSAEQFYNEKLITDVLGIGIKSGSIEWSSGKEPKKPVRREKVEAVVRELMAGGAEAAEMRRRAKELGEKARRAVEKGGSSYADAEALIEELRRHKRN